jgi:hypothetical protein
VAPSKWLIDGLLHNKRKGICMKEAVEKYRFVD